MTLKSGVWTLNIDGFVTSLNVQSVDPSGIVPINLQGAEVSFGLWDETAKHLTFMVETFAGNAPDYFDGYLITTPQDARPGADLQFTLVGTMQIGSRVALDLRRTNVRRSRYGWFATISEVA